LSSEVVVARVVALRRQAAASEIDEGEGSSSEGRLGREADPTVCLFFVQRMIKQKKRNNMNKDGKL